MDERWEAKALVKPIMNTLTTKRSGRNRVLFAVQCLVLTFMLACIGMFIAGIFDFHRYAAGHLVEFIPYTPIWTPQNFGQILARFGFNFDGWLLYKLATSILIASVFWGVGFLIFLRKGNDRFGLFIGALFVLFGTVSGDPITAFSGLHPQLNWILTPLGVFAWWGLFMLLFLFPNGQFVPRWTRWIALLLLLVYTVIIVGYGSSTPPPPLILVVVSLFGVGAASQVHRYRKISSPFERQQTKWVMFMLVITFIVLILSLLPLAFPDLLNPGSPAIFATLVLPNLPSYFLTLIPLSVAFAIFRYHLWDIDLVIRRTLLYGTLTATLGLVYFGGVLLLQLVFRGLSGQDSPLAVVISTLVIAALFTPLRLRLQVVIDRRFYRQKYNAEQAVTAFAAAARSETEVNPLTSQMVRVIEETVQPDKVWVWMKDRSTKL
jgi:hypothetical protein